jgi:carboxypeptidase-like protein/TonB-dependent receptor-like protein
MVTKYTICIIILLLFFSLRVSNAQGFVTLSGYLLDAENGESLIGANIIIENTSMGAASNQYGFYSITLKPGKYSFEYSYVGYQSLRKEINLTESKRINIELQPFSLTSEEIVISSERENENIQSTEMSVAKLDINTVQKIPVVLGEPDILKTIQLLPGISSATENSSGINVRGGAADQNLVLLDESPVYNVSHLFGFFSVFNSNALKDLKVYKGGIPARYGGRLSSVIDVHQKDGNSKNLNFSGGIGTISSQFLFEGPIQKDKSAFMIAGRRSYGDLILKMLGENENTAYFYDLNFKANYTLGQNDRVFAAGYLGRDKFNLSGLFGSSWGNSTFSLRWNHLFSDQLFNNFTVAYSNYDYNLDFLPSGSEYNWKSKIINLNVKSDFTFFLSDQNIIDFGIGGIYYNFKPGEINPIYNSSVIPTKLDDKYAIEPSTYISIDKKISKKLNVQFGLRLSALGLGKQTIYNYKDNSPIVYNEYYGRYEKGSVIDSTFDNSGKILSNYFGLEPRFSARYTINTSSSLKFSYNRTRQYIHLISNSTSPTPLDIWIPSGKYIKPQINDQIALGYFRNFDNNTYEASFEIYYKSMQNQIDYVDGADLKLNNKIENQLLNGIGRAYGAEFYIKKSKGKFTWWTSYTLGRSEKRIRGITDKDPGINNGNYYPAQYDKTHNLSMTAIYDYNDKWSFSSNFVLASGRAVTYPKSRYEIFNLIIPHYEDRNQDRLPMSHRLDISATLRDAWGGDWIFSIYNVYNKHNANAIRFRQNEKNPQTSEAVQTYLFGILPSITYNFKF